MPTGSFRPRTAVTSWPRRTDFGRRSSGCRGPPPNSVGTGTILEAREVKPGKQTRNDFKWHPSSLDREYRWTATQQRGATIWFTGLAASGKSTRDPKGLYQRAPAGELTGLTGIDGPYEPPESADLVKQVLGVPDEKCQPRT
ncbi:hypothetical protein MSAR_19940 [Mycolicibacterium sarraceniae]|uniref:APS kinase domain-containing protein n=1 Tax=Mycolicibacterium sarraceniae TaxID=1534348 RepID=A0A7I7SPX2_9MYCO|nr:hypothetical protein MSAR_19940 [Mycolicibacterium sarraceniae]